MAFEAHCIVEIMGHQVIAGKVSEETHFGSPLMRVDVPKSSKRDGFTVYYGGGAIYKITPTTEDIVKAFVEKQDPEPVKPYMLALPSFADKVDESSSSRHIYGPLDEDDYSDEEDDDEGFGEAFPKDDDDDLDDEDEALTDKQKAAATARRIVAEPFIVIDTETTSLSHDIGEVIQFAAIDQDGKVLLNTYIKSKSPIPNTDYHGITDEMVKDAPDFAAIYPKIKELLDSAPVMVYNLAYDWKMLDANARRNDLGSFSFKAPSCVMELYAQFYGEWNQYHSNYKWQKLNAAVERFGLKFEGTEHDALADAKATLGVLKKMAEWSDEKVKEARELPY